MMERLLKSCLQATYSQALEDSGNDVSSLGGLQLFLNLERVAQSLLPIVSSNRMINDNGTDNVHMLLIVLTYEADDKFSFSTS